MARATLETLGTWSLPTPHSSNIYTPKSGAEGGKRDPETEMRSPPNLPLPAATKPVMTHLEPPHPTPSWRSWV